eukprot:m.26387 g.26387  ORF g.26387 m.26387 type:complete len:634 (-) comp4283_c1_seq1:202-2103(-)
MDAAEKEMLSSSFSQIVSDMPLPTCAQTSSRPSPIDINENYIEPEPQEGNMEYKLKLIDPTPSRFQHLVTQMKWRLAEGNGEALYVIGVEDDGFLTGLAEDQLLASLRTLEAMAAAAGAQTTVLRTRVSVRGAGQVAEVLVRRVPDNQQFLEVRVAAVGSAGSGKSTVLGVLVGEELDNGHGKARLNLFRHRHEITSGTTSSICHGMLGFDSNGDAVNHALPSGHDASTSALSECASKIVSFFDFPGHERYMKTTLLGFSSRSIDYVALVVGSSTGMSPSTLAQLEVVTALQLPFFVIVTKIDLCTRPVLAATLKDLTQHLKAPGCKRIAVIVNNMDDVCCLGSSFHKDRIVPIFLVSSVSGKNIDLLRRFLNLLAVDTGAEEKCGLPPLVQISEVFNVAGVGPVVAGTLLEGVVREGDRMRIGPDDSGSFLPVVVRNIHRNRVPFHLVKAGQHASFALDGIAREAIRRGQILAGDASMCVACKEFEADVLLTSSSVPLVARAQVSAFVGTVRQQATVVSIDAPDGALAQGHAARVRLQFLCRPEHVLNGARLLLHGPRLRAFGTVAFTDAPAPELPDGASSDDCADLSGNEAVDERKDASRTPDSTPAGTPTAANDKLVAGSDVTSQVVAPC